jgi:hypothetical protein
MKEVNRPLKGNFISQTFPGEYRNDLDVVGGRNPLAPGDSSRI